MRNTGMEKLDACLRSHSWELNWLLDSGACADGHNTMQPSWILHTPTTASVLPVLASRPSRAMRKSRDRAGVPRCGLLPRLRPVSPRVGSTLFVEPCYPRSRSIRHSLFSSFYHSGGCGAGAGHGGGENCHPHLRTLPPPPDGGKIPVHGRRGWGPREMEGAAGSREWCYLNTFTQQVGFRLTASANFHVI